MKTLYRCDYTNVTFDNIEECLIHEECAKKALKNAKFKVGDIVSTDRWENINDTFQITYVGVISISYKIVSVWYTGKHTTKGGLLDFDEDTIIS